jgi:lysophospholipase L1-like esterase
MAWGRWGQTRSARVPGAGRMGMSSNLRYQTRIKNLFGSSLIAYWPLWETSGTDVLDFSGNGRNAVSKNLAMANAIGLDGNPAPLFDGSTSAVNFNSTSLNTAFNMAEGAIVHLCKVSAAGDWTDAANRYAWYLFADGSNGIYVRKSSVNNVMRFSHNSGAVANALDFPTLAPTQWMQTAIEWSASGNYTRFYYNGFLIASYAGPALWTGNLTTAIKLLGSSAYGTPANVWKGWQAHGFILNTPPGPANVRLAYKNYIPGVQFISVLGDSISDGAGEWPSLIAETRPLAISDHAVASMGILQGATNMAAQVTATANDNADKIIIALGTNDSNAGDMGALQTAAENGIDALRVSNPNAALYWLGPLPKWTNNTGATPVDLSNIRTAIQAACTAKSVIYWDSFTTPWITAGQTSDGTHPTAEGHAAIAAQVLARLP